MTLSALRDALKPFAEAAATIPDSVDDDVRFMNVKEIVKIGHLRTARTALSASEAEMEGVDGQALQDLQQFVNDWSGEWEDTEQRDVSKRAVAALTVIRSSLSERAHSGRERKHKLSEARGHLGAALVQSAASDDQIIIGHVRDAERLIEEVLEGGL